MGKIKTVVLCFIMLFLFGCAKKDRFVIQQTVTVYESYPYGGFDNESKVIDTIHAGEVVEIIHVRYSKDAMFFKVRLENGKKGYILWGPKLGVKLTATE